MVRDRFIYIFTIIILFSGIFSSCEEDRCSDLFGNPVACKGDGCPFDEYDCEGNCIPNGSSCCANSTITGLFEMNDTEFCIDSGCCDSGDCADEPFLCPEVFDCPEEYIPCGYACIKLIDSFGEMQECQFERECEDGLDNDNDGDVDCDDVDCFSKEFCPFPFFPSGMN